MDVLRFLAALSVVLFHLSFASWIEPTANVSTEFSEQIVAIGSPFRWGWTGVQTFFVISGFVIAFSASGLRPATFIRNRFLRLYPAVWICATITLLVADWADNNPLGPYFRSLILWPLPTWISGVYWTLAVEMAFYAVVAAAIHLKIRIVTVGIALGLWSSIYWAFRCLDYISGGHLEALFDLPQSPLGMITLLSSGCHFALGVLICSSLQAPPSRRIRALISAIAFTAAIEVAATAKQYIDVQGGDYRDIWQPMVIWGTSMAAFLCSVVFNGKVWGVLGGRAKLIRNLGLITYPLYLVHHELGVRVMEISSVFAPALSLLFGVFVVIGVAWIAMVAEGNLRRSLDAYLPGSMPSRDQAVTNRRAKP